MVYHKTTIANHKSIICADRVGSNENKCCSKYKQITLSADILYNMSPMAKHANISYAKLFCSNVFSNPTEYNSKERWIKWNTLRVPYIYMFIFIVCRNTHTLASAGLVVDRLLKYTFFFNTYITLNITFVIYLNMNIHLCDLSICKHHIV